METKNIFDELIKEFCLLSDSLNQKAEELLLTSDCLTSSELLKLSNKVDEAALKIMR